MKNYNRTLVRSCFICWQVTCKSR